MIISRFKQLFLVALCAFSLELRPSELRPSFRYSDWLRSQAQKRISDSDREKAYSNTYTEIGPKLAVATEVKKINDSKGFGLVAKENIKKGTFIGHYGGDCIFVNPEEAETLYLHGSSIYSVRLPFGRKKIANGELVTLPQDQEGSIKFDQIVFLDAERRGNLLRFANHSHNAPIMEVNTGANDPNTCSLPNYDNVYCRLADGTIIKESTRSGNVFRGERDDQIFVNINGVRTAFSLNKDAVLERTHIHRVPFYATEDIQAGTELKWDYGDNYWKALGITPQE